MDDTLGEALERGRGMITGALTQARAELDALRSREAELERQIAEAELILGDTTAKSTETGRLTLHEALAEVLEAGGNAGMTARELADAINERGLYAKRDGSPVEANQVQARVNNYREMFEKDGSLIRLQRESSVLSAAPAGTTIFRDDDDGFFDWIEAHPDGFFVNTERNPKANYLVLHKPQCPHITGGRTLHWTKDYVKVCSNSRAELEEWASSAVGGEVTLCRSCFG